MIADLGEMFVTTYLVPFELMALLLLAALAGAISAGARLGALVASLL